MKPKVLERERRRLKGRKRERICHTMKQGAWNIRNERDRETESAKEREREREINSQREKQGARK